MEKNKKKRIAVVGVGFSGLMTSIHLIKNARSGMKLYLINDKHSFGKGIAYSTSSGNHLLNVPAAKMSCIPSSPDHFVDWIYRKHPYNLISKEMLGRMFLPRKEYGEYLLETWNETLKDKDPGVEVEIISGRVNDVIEKEKNYYLVLDRDDRLEVDYIILATGNEVPGNPRIKDPSFYNSKRYYNDPWKPESTANLKDEKDILIIGSGLTMVDTVLSLLDNKFKGTIYCVTRNGYNVLPHRHSGISYSGFLEEMHEPFDINSLFRLFRKHINIIRKFGLSAEPLVDSIRPITQRIWTKLNKAEKERFLLHLRHFWNVARHRLPIHVHDTIQNLRIDGKLIIKKGRPLHLEESGGEVKVEYWDRNLKQNGYITVTRVINCSGPISDITKTRNALLINMFKSGLIREDDLNLGIDAMITGAVLNSYGKPSDSIFTLGSNLRGLLWETTAVPELRVQAENLAQLIIDKMEYSEESVTV